MDTKKHVVSICFLFLPVKKNISFWLKDTSFRWRIVHSVAPKWSCVPPVASLGVCWWSWNLGALDTSWLVTYPKQVPKNRLKPMFGKRGGWICANATSYKSGLMEGLPFFPHNQSTCAMSKCIKGMAAPNRGQGRPINIMLVIQHDIRLYFFSRSEQFQLKYYKWHYMTLYNSFSRNEWHYSPSQRLQ